MGGEGEPQLPSAAEARVAEAKPKPSPPESSGKQIGPPHVQEPSPTYPISPIPYRHAYFGNTPTSPTSNSKTPAFDGCSSSSSKGLHSPSDQTIAGYGRVLLSLLIRWIRRRRMVAVASHFVPVIGVFRRRCHLLAISRRTRPIACTNQDLWTFGYPPASSVPAPTHSSPIGSSKAA
jgi:hypothetical protein